MAEADSTDWMEKRTLVIAWLLFFFPVGLYGIWKGTLFDDKTKWIITGAVAAVVIVLGGGVLLDFVYVGVLCPLAVYLLRKDPAIAKPRLTGSAARWP